MSPETSETGESGAEAGGRRGRAIVFAAPSGAGKTTIIHRIREIFPQLVFSVSATTRPRRNGERDGVDYDFISREEFLAGIEAGDFIEHEEVHGHLYGTRRSRVEPLLDEGRVVVFDLDVLGALTVKSLYPSALLIYIDVLSKDTLRQRLVDRGREDDAEIERRLKRYEMEHACADRFDVVVINDDLEKTVAKITGVIRRYLESGTPPKGREVERGT